MVVHVFKVLKSRIVKFNIVTLMQVKSHKKPFKAGFRT